MDSVEYIDTHFIKIGGAIFKNTSGERQINRVFILFYRYANVQNYYDELKRSND